MSPGHIVAVVVAVLVAAGVVWRRRRLSTERILIGLAVALALAVYASGLLSQLPDPKKLIEHVAVTLGPWTYALVGVMAFLETGAFVGLVAPGETVVMAGGVIAGQGEIELIPLIGLVWICAVLGDTASFFIGRRLGRTFLERHGARVKITHERLTQVDGYFERHGGKTILIGRFIGLVRAIAPFIAGASGLAYRSFIPYSVVGAGLWSTLFCVLGYVFWSSFDQVADIAGKAVFGFGLTVAVIVGVAVAYRRRRELRDWLLARRDRPLVRPLFVLGGPIYRRVVRPFTHVLRPRLRFLWERLTPGGLGLELTTSLAVGGVGMYVFALYVVVLDGSLGPTPFDRDLLDLADRLHTAVGVDVAKVITSFGTFPAVTGMLLVTLVLLASSRRWTQIVTLVLGLVLVYVAVQLAKAGIDRPRPGRPLVATSNASYPSGHAAYATAWVAAAVALSRRVGLGSQATLVLAALGLTIAIGLSRIYLRAHYWSDVAGGWGLGAGIFGLLAATALIVEHIRHNGTERATGTPARSDR
jgi:membrane protein DedA with SNARE-associated domain/membrane-associated phospholipid phosphatase